jgi:hypothetical protein
MGNEIPGHKLLSMLILGVTATLAVPELVSDWWVGVGVSYVTSLKGYRRIPAVGVQPSTLHVYIAAASHNSLNKMVKYGLLHVQY